MELTVCLGNDVLERFAPGCSEKNSNGKLVLEALNLELLRSEPSRRIKLMVVGQQAVGKTTLIEALTARKWTPMPGTYLSPFCLLVTIPAILCAFSRSWP